jgi:hypothetical protein
MTLFSFFLITNYFLFLFLSVFLRKKDIYVTLFKREFSKVGKTFKIDENVTDQVLNFTITIIRNPRSGIKYKRNLNLNYRSKTKIFWSEKT